MFVESGLLSSVLPASAAADSIRLDGQVGADWDSLPEALQVMLAGAALRRAAATIAFQAETLAREMESGGLEDFGGPDALRLLSAIVRVTSEPGIGDDLPE
jgi:hypothetical protein